jgi:hypothetical protein
MAGSLLMAGFAAPVYAGEPGGFVQLEFDTELTSLNLSGGPFPIPLAADPGNALGDSIDGYGFVNSQVMITLSSQRLPDAGPASMGVVFATPFAPALAGSAAGDEMPQPTPINPSEWDGQTFFVNSFFDVFFDITVTDVDPRPGRDFAGMPDGASVPLPDNGPASMQSNYEVIFDMDEPNFGLIPPPEVAPYFGHFLIEIPLGGDINGNGDNDKIKFTLATHSVGDENRTFIQLPDGTVIDQFDSAAFLEGAVVDESSDPPFTIGMIDPNTGLPDPSVFGGPTTASSNVRNPIVPEPTGLTLLAMGGLLAGVFRRGRRG